MDKIKAAFEGKKANIGYIVAGYPSPEHTKEFISNLNNSTLDLLEIGIPYTDPIADGETIFNASFSANEQGVTTDTVFDILEQSSSNKAIVLLVYYNLIFAYGIENFINRAKKVGVSGLIVPDLPYEENEELFDICTKNSIALIPLVSVTSEHRAKKVLSRSSGFIYALGAIGVTGSKQTPLQRLQNMVKDLKKMSDLPVAVGFGIRTKDDVITTKSYADGAIVGTSIVALSAKFSGEEFIKKVDELFA